MSEQG